MRRTQQKVNGIWLELHKFDCKDVRLFIHLYKQYKEELFETIGEARGVPMDPSCFHFSLIKLHQKGHNFLYTYHKDEMPVALES